MLPKREMSVDGLEMTLQSNHLGHFLLTHLLLPYLHEAPAGRVVHVASSLHRQGVLDLKDLQTENGYSMFKAYSQSKLANMLFAMELHRRLKGTSVTSNALHPGNVMTEVTRNLPAWVNFLHGHLIYYFEAPFIKCRLEFGAYCSLHVATSPVLLNQGGCYFVHTHKQHPSHKALDPLDAGKLYDMSVELVGGARRCKPLQQRCHS